MWFNVKLIDRGKMSIAFVFEVEHTFVKILGPRFCPMMDIMVQHYVVALSICLLYIQVENI